MSERCIYFLLHPNGSRLNIVYTLDEGRKWRGSAPVFGWENIPCVWLRNNSPCSTNKNIHCVRWRKYSLVESVSTDQNGRIFPMIQLAFLLCFLLLQRVLRCMKRAELVMLSTFQLDSQCPLDLNMMFSFCRCWLQDFPALQSSCSTIIF